MKGWGSRTVTIGLKKEKSRVLSFDEKQLAMEMATKCQNVMSLLAGICFESCTATPGLAGVEALKLKMETARNLVQVHPSIDGKKWEVEIREVDVGNIIPEESKSIKKTLGEKFSGLFK